MRNKKIKLYFGKPIEFTWTGRTMTGKYDRQWRKIYKRIAHEMRRFKHKRYKRIKRNNNFNKRDLKIKHNNIFYIK